MRIHFIVRGVPQPKLRARHRVIKGAAGQVKGVATYTPAKTRHAEESFLAQCVQHQPKSPFPGPLRLELLCVMPIPASTPKKRVADLLSRALPWHTKKPDLDNLEKLVKDALNGVFWVDDSQVCDVIKRKLYGSIPRVEVAIEELG